MSKKDENFEFFICFIFLVCSLFHRKRTLFFCGLRKGGVAFLSFRRE